MLEVVTHVWCDKHLAWKQEKVDAITRQLGADDRWYEVEMCQDCWSQDVAPLARFLDEFGVKESSGHVPPSVIPQAKSVAVKKSALPAQQEELNYGTAEADRVFCWIPGCLSEIRSEGVARHMRKNHGLNREMLTNYCPACDQGFERTALVTHTRSVHHKRLDEVYRDHFDGGDEGGRVMNRLMAAGWALEN